MSPSPIPFRLRSSSRPPFPLAAGAAPVSGARFAAWLAAWLAALVLAGATCTDAQAGKRGARRAAPAPGYAERTEVRAFAAEMAARHGFDAPGLLSMFARVRRSDEALRLVAPPAPAFKRSWHAYRARFLDELRIREGLRFWNDNETALAQASERFGVPAAIVVAIIGVETIYGRVTGEHRVLDVLTTLAFDEPRRRDYFRAELEQYLLLGREAGVDAFSVRGSYAGAIGLPQFMPGSVRRFALDFDGDGAIDLRSSAADAIGSVANFLAEHGWRGGEPVRLEMRFDSEQRLAPLVEAGIRPQFTLAQLAEHGVASDEPADPGLLLALIDLPNGDDAPSYYLGAPNFFAITRYNRSSFYAMAVHDLARELAQRRLADSPGGS